MKSIVLLSGGIDSTVLLGLAVSQKRNCIALSFNYGQRNHIELESAKAIATHYGVSHNIICLSHPALGSTSLTNEDLVAPSNRTPLEIAQFGIPNTYVPARNTLFLSYAMSFAEVIDAGEIYFGANAMDFHPYPDCRPNYFEAFQSLLNLATKQALEGKAPKLLTPLINWDKATIIAKGIELGVPLDLTFSCYTPLKTNLACNHCDACILRKKGFEAVQKIKRNSVQVIGVQSSV